MLVLIHSDYANHCRACKAALPVGSLILWNPDVPGVYCSGCGPADTPQRVSKDVTKMLGALTAEVVLYWLRKHADQPARDAVGAALYEMAPGGEPADEFPTIDDLRPLPAAMPAWLDD